MLRNKQGYQMFSHEVLKEFGLAPSSPIPPNYSAEKEIDGVMVYIYPRGALNIKRRVVAKCPVCYRLVCAGHLNQHFKIHRKGG
jgi:hypothetical protein